MMTVRLLEWHRSWKLAGNVVHCRRCAASQHEDDGDSDFKHAETCTARHLEQRPWCALNRLLKDT